MRKYFLGLLLFLSVNATAQVVGETSPGILVGTGHDVQWNPADISGGFLTFSNGNHTVTNASGPATGRATKSVGSVKVYWEVFVDAVVNYPTIGIMQTSFSMGSVTLDMGQYSGGWEFIGYNGAATGFARNNASGIAYGDVYTTHDIIGVAYDGVNGVIYFRYNGTWEKDQFGVVGDPTSGATHTGAAFWGITGPISPAYSTYGGNSFTLTIRGTAASLTYSIPSGYTVIP